MRRTAHLRPARSAEDAASVVSRPLDEFDHLQERPAGQIRGEGVAAPRAGAARYPSGAHHRGQYMGDVLPGAVKGCCQFARLERGTGGVQPTERSQRQVGLTHELQSHSYRLMESAICHQGLSALNPGVSGGEAVEDETHQGVGSLVEALLGVGVAHQRL